MAAALSLLILTGVDAASHPQRGDLERPRLVSDAVAADSRFGRILLAHSEPPVRNAPGAILVVSVMLHNQGATAWVGSVDVLGHARSGRHVVGLAMQNWSVSGLPPSVMDEVATFSSEPPSSQDVSSIGDLTIVRFWRLRRWETRYYSTSLLPAKVLSLLDSVEFERFVSTR